MYGASCYNCIGLEGDISRDDDIVVTTPLAIDEHHNRLYGRAIFDDSDNIVIILSFSRYIVRFQQTMQYCMDAILILAAMTKPNFLQYLDRYVV